MYYAQLKAAFSSTLAQFKTSFVSDAIAISDAYSRSSVNLAGSSVTGSGDSAVIEIQPRVQESEVSGVTPRWLEPSAQVTGVNGFRPTFRFLDYASGVYNGYPWQTARRPMFSYDRLTWHYFDTQTVNSTYIEFRHNTAFAADTVYISRGRQTSVSQTGDWLEAMATAYPALIGPADSAVAFTPTLTTWPAQSFIADEFASQTNELGGTIPATPFYAAEINDTSLMPASGVKSLAVITAGIHAGEDHAEFAMRQFVEYALGNSAEAQNLRRYYRILVYPMLNAPGRDGGGWRGSFTQGVGGIDDGNRHFSDASPGLEIVTIPRTAMISDMGAETPVWAIDWHGTFRYPFSLFVDPGNTLQAELRTRLATNSGFTVEDEGDTVSGFVSRWYQDTVGAEIAVTLEHGDPSPVSDANLATWGQAVVESLDSMRVDGLIGPSDVTGAMATTEAGVDSASASGDVLVQGVAAATESGSDVFAATGAQIVAGTLAATEAGDDTLAFTGSVLVAGTAAATESGADTLSVAGSVLVQGSAAAVESGADTFTGSGSGIATGDLAAAESGQDTISSAGQVIVSGAVAATESGIDSLIASGDIIVSGALAATESGTDTFSAAGGDISIGALAATEAGNDAASIDGTVLVSGDCAATEIGGDSAVLNGNILVQGFLGAAETGLDSFSTGSGAQFLAGNPRVWTLPDRSHTWALPNRSYTWEVN